MTGIPWFWNFSLSCLWLGCSYGEIEVGSVWLRNCAAVHVQLFSRALWSEPWWGTVHTHCLFVLQSPLFHVMDPSFFVRLWPKSVDCWQTNSWTLFPHQNLDKVRSECRSHVCFIKELKSSSPSLHVYSLWFKPVCKGQTVIFPN